ncbi:MAG TPA: LPS export ABC transporter periplasmic protein LptC [Verrucomicrobiae bacterium]|nr:LPS export ABC transporter periplasmic protein LptC [Verrucomicrobiae bacterium]
MIRSLAALAALALLAAAPPPGPPGRLPPPKPSASAAKSPSPRPSAPRPGPSSPGPSFDLGVWTVHASSIDANFKTGTFSTPDKVTMTRVGGDVAADRSDGNYKQQLVNLYGHVVMHDANGDYGGIGSKGGSAPSTLTTDKAQIDGKAKIYKAFGNVHFVQADTNVTSDNGTLDDLTHELDLQGNVHVTQGARSITADSVRYNTVTGVAHAQGDVTMQFPGGITRTLATPRPLHLPKTPVSEPVPAATASP